MNNWWRYANRHERLHFNPDGLGLYIDAPWSSDLHACEILPSWGKRLFRAAIKQWPIQLEVSRCQQVCEPNVSFIIPHRGRNRLPLLRATVASILAQTGVSVECLVVEQNQTAQIEEGDLPPGACYLHLPHVGDPDVWHFAWAFNEGARAAKADILVFHDGDILVPVGYASEVVRCLDAGWDAAYLQRFLFCISEADTQLLCASSFLASVLTPERIRQNWKGGTRAVRRSCFDAVGGFDESFVNWGGEDVEFFDRLLAFKINRYGYLPFVHAWHTPQSAKVDSRRKQNLGQLEVALRTPREERISRLRKKLASRWKNCGIGLMG